MLPTKQKINRFLRTSGQYKKFIDTVSFIISLLTPEQLKILEIQYEGKVIDFKIQLLFDLENRYKNYYWTVEELRARSTKALNKYKFLFETNLRPQQIRTILLRELVEVISFGFLCYDSPSDDKYIGEAIKEKYPNLPPRKRNKKLVYFWEECFDRFHTLIFRDEGIEKLWYSEFFKRTKWYFEQLNSCEPEYIDKYREKIYKEIRFTIRIWNNHYLLGCNRHLGITRSDQVKIGYYTLHVYEVKTNTDTYLQELIEEILSCFSEEELASLEKIDSHGETWSFKEQLLSRYYSKYTSFVPLEEIKSQIKKRVEQYKPLLRIENKKETIKELLLYELEKGIFVPEDTHFWNQKMIKNLNTPKTIWDKRFFSINRDVKRMLDLIGQEHEKHFYLEIEGKKYDLRTLLIARWKHAIWIPDNKGKHFKKNKIFAIVYPEILKNKDMSKFDMQSFLERMDFFFLTPEKLTTSKKRYFFCTAITCILLALLVFMFVKSHLS